MAVEISRLGSPQIRLAGLSIWVHGRQFPDHDDYWDGNWINVTAHCGQQGASVTVGGPIIHLSEIREWCDALTRMHEALSGEAKLCGDYEANLSVNMEIDRSGHLFVEVQITPDQMSQRHSFKYELDQTYLSPLLSQCSGVLDQYPIRGRQQGGFVG